MASYWISEMQRMSKKELFEHCKSLQEQIDELNDYEPADRDDENQTVSAYFHCVHELNRHLDLLYRRMFHTHKIFRTV